MAKDGPGELVDLLTAQDTRALANVRFLFLFTDRHWGRSVQVDRLESDEDSEACEFRTELAKS